MPALNQWSRPGTKKTPDRNESIRGFPFFILKIYLKKAPFVHEGLAFLFRQVFWLSRPFSGLPIPGLEQWHTRLKGFPYPFGKGGTTAAGPSPILTGFPIKLNMSTWTLWNLLTKNRIKVNTKIEKSDIAPDIASWQTFWYSVNINQSAI